MKLDELISLSLTEARKKLPGAPRIANVLHRVGKDAAGDDAVFIVVVLGDETPEEQKHWNTLGPISLALGQAAQHAFQFDLDVVPHVEFVTEAEAKEQGLATGVS